MFNTLNYDAQVERLHKLAQEAMGAYELPDADFELLSYTNNAVYHIIDRNPRYVREAHYVLRLHRPGLKRLEWIRSELTWLTAIRWHTTLDVPEPAGEVYTGSIDGIDSPIYCTLLGWVRGQPVDHPQDLTQARVFAAGQFVARLHQFAQTYEPPEMFVRPSLNLEGLFGTDSPYASAGEDSYFTDAHRTVIQRVKDHVAAIMDDRSLHLIHGDLIMKNILFTEEDDVGAIDFDDCAFGYPLYDLTPLLWRCRDEPNYDFVRNALWDGYTSIIPHDVQDEQIALEAFLMARHVASCRWVAGNADHPAIRGKAHDIIAARVDEMRRFLDTGKLR